MKMNIVGFDPDRMKKFVENTVEEYNSNLIVNKYVKNVPIPEESTDDAFIQVALRGLFNVDIFRPQRGSVHIAPRVLGLGREISIGEGRYLFEKIIEDSGISEKSKDLKKSDLSPGKLLELCEDITIGEILVPLPLYFKEIMRSNDWWRYYDKSVAKLLLLPSLSVSGVPYSLFSDKILVLGSHATEWKFAEFDNNVTGTTERLNIKFGELRGGGKIDITIGTLNKFEIINKDNIKLINLID